MTLAVTASKFNSRPSELAGIDDPAIAFAFDVECADVLFQSELDRETEQVKAMIEMSGVGQLTTAMSGGGNGTALVPRGFDTSKANLH